ncbi:MAG: protein kinase [Chloroflexi bacterium]|nr:protein kinase [Chloroflexota bacterium]
MTSERAQRRIERLLDRIDAAEEADDWRSVRILSQNVLAVDPDNAEAAAYLEAAERWLADVGPITATSSLPTGESQGEGNPSGREDEANAPSPILTVPIARTPFSAVPSAAEGEEDATPTSFANGRYQVSKFLGEGGKKRVYRAHDTLLDRDVAFALIKTEGFDQSSRERISREAQAMGRLGVHPNIVAVLDLGQEVDGSPFMVTELMGGGDVEGLLEKTTPESFDKHRTGSPP